MAVNNFQENHMFISIDTSLDTAQKGLRSEKIRTLHIKKPHRSERKQCE